MTTSTSRWFRQSKLCRNPTGNDYGCGNIIQFPQPDRAKGSTAEQQGADTIDVWLANARNFIPPNSFPSETVLSAVERERMKRFHFAKDSLLYCTAHAMKRILLSSYEPVCRPRQWRFIENPYGKPMVRSTPSGLPLHFNLSHSWPIVAVAISRRYLCGIDVECSNDFTVQHEEMQAVLHPADRERIAKSTEKNRCFLDIWTQKEAAAKAVGSGLSWDFESFHVCPESGQVHCEPSLHIPVTARSIPTGHKQLLLAVGWIGNCGDPKLSTPKWLSWPPDSQHSSNNGINTEQ